MTKTLRQEQSLSEFFSEPEEDAAQRKTVVGVLFGAIGAFVGAGLAVAGRVVPTSRHSVTAVQPVVAEMKASFQEEKNLIWHRHRLNKLFPSPPPPNTLLHTGRFLPLPWINHLQLGSFFTVLNYSGPIFPSIALAKFSSITLADFFSITLAIFSFTYNWPVFLQLHWPVFLQLHWPDFLQLHWPVFLPLHWPVFSSITLATFSSITWANNDITCITPPKWM